MSSIKRGLVLARWQRMASARQGSNQMANGGSRRPKEKSRRGNRVSRRPTETWRRGNQRSRRPEEKVRPGNRQITPAKEKIAARQSRITPASSKIAAGHRTGLLKIRGGLATISKGGDGLRKQRIQIEYGTAKGLRRPKEKLRPGNRGSRRPREKSRRRIVSIATIKKLISRR